MEAFNYERLAILLSRTSPFIITEIDQADKREQVKKVLSLQGNPLVVESIPSPQALYDLLQSNRSETLVFDCEILQKRKNYLDILVGALCSSPDSAALWQISYLDYPEFTFAGSIVIFSAMTKAEIRGKKRLASTIRDCHFI